jgi:hypothetical protein
MEQNTKLFFLFQTTVSVWYLSLMFISLLWTWTMVIHQETRGRKGPGINLKEL